MPKLWLEYSPLAFVTILPGAERPLCVESVLLVVSSRSTNYFSIDACLPRLLY